MTGRALELLVFGIVAPLQRRSILALLSWYTPLLLSTPIRQVRRSSAPSRRFCGPTPGHHRFTFRRTGSHHFYFPRFVAISVMLSAMAVCGTYFATHSFGVDYQLAAFGLTISTPLASFALIEAGYLRKQASQASAERPGRTLEGEVLEVEVNAARVYAAILHSTRHVKILPTSQHRLAA